MHVFSVEETHPCCNNNLWDHMSVGRHTNFQLPSWRQKLYSISQVQNKILIYFLKSGAYHAELVQSSGIFNSAWTYFYAYAGAEFGLQMLFSWCYPTETRWARSAPYEPSSIECGLSKVALRATVSFQESHW